MEFIWLIWCSLMKETLILFQVQADAKSWSTLVNEDWLRTFFSRSRNSNWLPTTLNNFHKLEICCETKSCRRNVWMKAKCTNENLREEFVMWLSKQTPRPREQSDSTKLGNGRQEKTYYKCSVEWWIVQQSKIESKNLKWLFKLYVSK